MIHKISCCFFSLLLAVILMPPCSHADDPVAIEKEKPAASEVIKQALTKKINLDFKESPLSEIVTHLQDLLKIPVQLDTKGLEEEGVTPDTPVTLTVAGITAKSALHLLLHPLHLSATIQDEVLLITTEQVADTNIRVVVYDVADLVAVSKPPAVSWNDLLTENLTVPIQFGEISPKEGPETDFDSLIDTITRSISPTTWDSAGGMGSIQAFEAPGIRAIVVSQTDEIQEKVADLLSQLRALRKKSDSPLK
jgi:general secretion pathway protein D